MKVYLAIPYTRHEKLSFSMANYAASEIIKMGHIPFSPISMSHPIVVESKKKGNFEKELLGTWDVWSKIDMSFIDWCDEVWVCNLDTGAVQDSTGVQAEIAYAKKLGKRVRTINVNYKEPYRSAELAMKKGANRDVVDYLDNKEWEYEFEWPIIKEGSESKNSRLLAEKITIEIEDCPTHYDVLETIQKILD